MPRQKKHPDFNAPPTPKLTRRRTTLTGLFYISLTPYIPPTASEVDDALKVLGMKRGEVCCAYCGDAKSEWDHLNSIVSGSDPSGFITELANLVPSCGKCNQSKGSKPWLEWMKGEAKLSPNGRGIPEQDTEKRIKRLQKFELAYRPTKIDYSALFGAKAWGKHIGHLGKILKSLEKAEAHAVDLRSKAAAYVTAARRSPAIVDATASTEDVESASLMAAAKGELCIPQAERATSSRKRA